MGLGLGGAAVLSFVAPGLERLWAPGRSTPGHEALGCEGCHQPAPGSLRQQLQAGARFLIGAREAPADFGFGPVTSTACLGCHERDGERHPIHRFQEPRFEQARAAARVDRCTGCHSEHDGARVSVAPDVCRHCHQGLELEADQVSPSHAALAQAGRFETCLGCHDFHGNHLRAPPARLEEAAPEAAVRAYLADGPAPYGDARRWPARLDGAAKRWTPGIPAEPGAERPRGRGPRGGAEQP